MLPRRVEGNLRPRTLYLSGGDLRIDAPIDFLVEGCPRLHNDGGAKFPRQRPPSRPSCSCRPSSLPRTRIRSRAPGLGGRVLVGVFCRTARRRAAKVGRSSSRRRRRRQQRQRRSGRGRDGRAVDSLPLPAADDGSEEPAAPVPPSTPSSSARAFVRGARARDDDDRKARRRGEVSFSQQSSPSFLLPSPLFPPLPSPPLPPAGASRAGQWATIRPGGSPNSITARPSSFSSPWRPWRRCAKERLAAAGGRGRGEQER